MNSFKNSLKKKLIISVSIFSTILLTIISAILYQTGKKAIIESTFEQLRSIRDIKKKHIEGNFNMIMSEAAIASGSFMLDKFADQFYSQTIKDSISFHSYPLEYFFNKHHCNAAYIKHNKHNYLFEAKYTKNKIHIKNLSHNSKALDIFSQKQSITNIFISDTVTSSNDSSFFYYIYAPIISDSHITIGATAFQFSDSIINKLVLTNDQLGFGQTGESIIVGSDGLYTSKKKTCENGTMKTKTNLTYSKESTLMTTNPEGVKVLRAYSNLNISGLEWNLVIDIEYNEVLSNINKLRSIFFLILFIMLVSILIATYFISKGITSPIRRLADAIHNNRTKELPEFPIKRKDEIGKLYHSFNQMTKNITIQKKELSEKEERINLFFNSTSDGILLHEGQKVILANKALSNLTGFTNEELMRFNAQSLYISKKTNKAECSTTYETKTLRKNKAPIHTEIQHSFANYKGKKINVCLIRDITVKTAARINSLKSEEQLYAVFNFSPIMKFIINDNYRVLTMNKVAQEVSQKKIQKHIGDILGCIYSLKNKEGCGQSSNCNKCKIRSSIKYTFETKQALKNIEVTTTKKNAGKTITSHYKISTVFLNSHEDPVLMLSVDDISTKKFNEKRLLSATIAVEENERKRFAQDLHDELGPFLSGIKLFVGKLGDTNLSDSEKEKLIEEIEELIDDAISKTRNISNNLTPNTLEDFGLTGALESFIVKINTIKKTKIEFIFEERINHMHKNMQIIFYRIIIELLNNSLKHANASLINIDIYIIKETIHIEYIDNGKGFDFEVVQKEKKGIGLLNIMNRLNNIDAHYTFDTSPNCGFKFNIEIPIL